MSDFDRVDSQPSSATSGVPNSKIYGELAKHQQVEKWFGQGAISDFQEWGERFNVQFKLEIPAFVIRIDYLSPACFGHFRRGHNGFGLRSEIAINARYFGDRERWEILGTLLHELLHAWQEFHGSPGDNNYHNAEFRKKAQEFGLFVSSRGETQYEFDSCFTRLLRTHGIETPVLSSLAEEATTSRPALFTSPKPRQRGNSKQKKWTCGCGINIRCARADFYAQCLRCGEVFEIQQ